MGGGFDVGDALVCGAGLGDSLQPPEKTARTANAEVVNKVWFTNGCKVLPSKGRLSKLEYAVKNLG